jgi:WS/DGAT/MGAT family acyltransferase
MIRLSGMDAMFLYGETPGTHLHVCAVIIVDPSTMPGGYSFNKIKSVMESRLHLVPQFRRRLATVPLGLHHPVWVDDADFDLDYHVRRIGCPAPCGPEEVGDIAADIAGRPLDRTKPLWEFWVVEGLADGQLAIIGKMHHSTIDGVSGANLMMEVLDLEPDPKDKPQHPEEFHPASVPSEWRLLGDALGEVVRHPLRIVKLVPSTVGAVASFVSARRSHETPSSGMATPFSAPTTNFNGPITPHRKVAFVDLPLDDIKNLRRGVEGATVNDVVMAVCSGALRRYLLGRNELPDKSLTAAVPVSVHAEAVEGAGANQVSVLFSTLHTDIEDPLERLQKIHDVNKGAKAEQKAIGASTLMGWTELAAPITFSLAMRLLSASRLADRMPPPFNLIISNVPGPPIPLYFCGARLGHLYPLGPILGGLGLNITVLSNMGHMNFGFIACRELMPDLWDLAHAVPEAVAELEKAVSANGNPNGSARTTGAATRPATKKTASKRTQAKKPTTRKTTTRKTTGKKSAAKKSTAKRSR